MSKKDGQNFKGERKPLIFNKGRIATLHFIEKDFGGRKVIVGKFGGDDVWPEDPRFSPKAGDDIECSVMEYEKRNRDGRGTRMVLKCLPHYPDSLRLTGRWTDWENIPPQRVKLTFRKQPRRGEQGEEIVAFHSGQPVFPERGHEVPLGVEHEYMKYYDSRRRCWVAYQARQFVAERGLSSKIGAKVQDITVLFRGELRTCYDLLGVPSTANEGQIQKAYRAKVVACHGDKIDSLGDPDLQAIALENTKALNEARDKALAVLGKVTKPREAVPTKAEVPKPEPKTSPSVEASEDKEQPAATAAAAPATETALTVETAPAKEKVQAEEVKPAPKPAVTSEMSATEKFNARYAGRAVATGPAKKKPAKTAQAKPAARTKTLAEELAEVAAKLK
jgi:hypothetical protein